MNTSARQGMLTESGSLSQSSIYVMKLGSVNLLVNLCSHFLNKGVVCSNQVVNKNTQCCTTTRVSFRFCDSASQDSKRLSRPHVHFSWRKDADRGAQGPPDPDAPPSLKEESSPECSPHQHRGATCLELSAWLPWLDTVRK